MPERWPFYSEILNRKLVEAHDSYRKKDSSENTLQPLEVRFVQLQTSEEKSSPEKYRLALEYLKETGIFDGVSGMLVGKPMDETYAGDYKQLLSEVIDRPELPVVFNLNIGHAIPRCIIPYGIEAVVDAEKQVIRFA